MSCCSQAPSGLANYGVWSYFAICRLDVRHFFAKVRNLTHNVRSKLSCLSSGGQYSSSLDGALNAATATYDNNLLKGNYNGDSSQTQNPEDLEDSSRRKKVSSDMFSRNDSLIGRSSRKRTFWISMFAENAGEQIPLNGGKYGPTDFRLHEKVLIPLT